MDSYDQIPETALKWHRDGVGAVLATVVQTWGSAPRRVGAQLVISGRGEIEGSVSGGCVEGAVIMEALDILETGGAKMLEFGVSDDDAFAVGLACGGTIRIWIESIGAALSEDLLQSLVDARAARKPVAYVINTETGDRRLDGDGHKDRFALDRSGFDEDGVTFVGIHNPPLRMVVVGAVHIAQSLVRMARMAGYDPYIIDPREAFGSEARFPGERILTDWPDEAVDQIGLDTRTALVLLTHDPKLDDPALKRALASDCFYIGALGSKRTHAKRVERLTQDGFDQDAIDRINGPVGLDIGAAGPAEIAVSIMAEITRCLRVGS